VLPLHTYGTGIGRGSWLQGAFQAPHNPNLAKEGFRAQGIADFSPHFSDTGVDRQIKKQHGRIDAKSTFIPYHFLYYLQVHYEFRPLILNFPNYPFKLNTL
jgi:hypothetical protein